MELEKLQKEVQNMNLSTTTASRLEIKFGEKADNIMNFVELEQAGASTMLKSLYNSLAFISKPYNYFQVLEGQEAEEGEETPFKLDLKKWCSLAGVRTLPDKVLQIQIKDILINDFGHLNELSVELAIKMNLKGVVWETVEPFDLMNIVFLTKILTKYDVEIKRANKRALEIREKLKPVQELTPEQIDIKMRADIIDIFEERKADDDRHSIKYLSYPIYEYLLKKGNLNPTTEQKLESMSMAPEILFAMKSKIMPPKELNDYKNDVNNTKNHKDLIDVAKCILVRDYFNSIEILQIEIINK